MALSVTDPMGPALSRTGLVLFRPFSLGKWMVLGFAAWLMLLGESSGGGNFGSNFGNWGGGNGPDGDEILDWIEANLGLVIAIAAVAMLLSIGIGLLFAWISSRARFIFIDGITTNRPAIVGPWKEFRTEGNSLFLFAAAIWLIGSFVVLAGLGAAALVALPDFEDRRFTGHGVAAIVIAIVCTIPVGLICGLIGFAMRQLVAPTMYARRLRVLAAWRVVREEILGSHLGSTILFLVFRILLVIVIGFIAAIVTFATCCIAALPYIGTVILLPLHVFSVSYTLSFLEQMGPQWRFFLEEGDICMECGYDLRGASSPQCPECGAPTVTLVRGDDPSDDGPPSGPGGPPSGGPGVPPGPDVAPRPPDAPPGIASGHDAGEPAPPPRVADGERPSPFEPVDPDEPVGPDDPTRV